MLDQDIIIRRMDRNEIDLAIEWAAKEGWNPGLHDAEAFYAADPNGFFIAESNGGPVGVASAVIYDEQFGFFGFYIVKEEFRNQGIGMKIFNARLKYMGNRTFGADGVINMLEKYQQVGYSVAHKNARYEGTGRLSQSSLADINSVPFKLLESYDRLFFPAPRTGFLKSWISRPGSHGRVVMDGDRMTGYGLIRPCRVGFKIAPLFADSPDIAEQLFVSLCGMAIDQPVFLDIPVCNQAAVELVERHGMSKVFDTARIYHGKIPQLPLGQIYGITSFELG